MSLDIIGDVHGKYASYYFKIKDLDHTLQLGDMGFNYNYHKQFIDADKHKFFGGNHDNYDVYKDSPHAIGEFGPYSHGNVDFFFIRGGLSIDLHYRTQGISWWAHEELCLSQAQACLALYEKEKPDIVISHECPMSAIPYVSTFPDYLIEQKFGVKLPSFTSKLLEELFTIHQPKLWVFGHFHNNREFKIGKTKFRCLDELATYKI